MIVQIQMLKRNIIRIEDDFDSSGDEAPKQSRIEPSRAQTRLDNEIRHQLVPSSSSVDSKRPRPSYGREISP